MLIASTFLSWLIAKPVFAQDERPTFQQLEVRDAIMFLSRRHNRQKNSAIKVYMGVGTQLPLSGFADATNKLNPLDFDAYNIIAAWFYQIIPAITFFYHLEIFAMFGAGFWSVEANINPLLHRTLTLEQTMWQAGGGAKYRFLRGDIVPFVAAFIGATFITLTHFQNFTPIAQEQITSNLFFAGGGPGVQLYISQHFGATIFLAYYLYLSVTNLQQFINPNFSHAPIFPSQWNNIMLSTLLFYEF